MRYQRPLLRHPLYALHGSLLRQQDLRGKAGLHPPRRPDMGLCVGGLRSRHGEGQRREFPAQRSEGADPLHRQIHGQHDDPDAEAAGCRLLYEQRRGAAVQRHHGRNPHNNCRARRLRGVQHLQAGRLPRKLPQRRAVHFRHRLHCRRDMDGCRRPPHRHCRGKADPL